MGFLRIYLSHLGTWLSTGLISVARLGAVLLLLAIGGRQQAAAQSRLSYEGWQLEWADEFNSPAEADSAALSAHWRFQYPWGRSLGFPESQFYSSKQVRSSPGGMLAFRSKKLAVPRPYQGRELRYESGMLFSYHPSDSLRPNQDSKTNIDGFSYGIFEIRCQMPGSRHSWPAFWLFGGVPDEVDIFEGNVGVVMNTTHVNGHEYWRPGASSQGCSCSFYATRRQDLHQSFHTYSLRWLPGELIFYFDGVPIRRETRYQMLGLPMDVVANLAMFEWGTVPADAMLIDYIRIYRPGPQLLARPEVPYRQPQTEVKSDLLILPRLSSVGAGADPTPRQQWQLLPEETGVVRLKLVENLNPVCSGFAALPEGPFWAPPWNITGGYPLVTVAGPPTLPWRWQLFDYLGRELRQGTVPADGVLRLAEQALEPGVYSVALHVAGQVVAQPLYIVDRATTTQPDPGWTLPAADSTSTLPTTDVVSPQP